MESIEIPPLSQQRLIQLSRQTLENFVLGHAKPVPPIDDPHLLTSDYGAFVTLYRGDELRGCIGTCFPTDPLYQTVAEMTEAAASRDHRVRPITPRELVEIVIDISVLSPLEPAAAPLSLEVGKHGLHLEQGRRRGVLLPQVATEHGWGMETFLRETCAKAGLPKDAWKSAETKISSFTALIVEEER
jgi:AmmeMemoRadiSam system protein A